MSIKNQDVSLKDVLEQTRLERFPQLYMEKYYTETYNDVKDATCRFNDELAIKLNQFYLNTVEKNVIMILMQLKDCQFNFVNI